MDFELIGMEGLVGQHNEGQSADQNSKRNFNGSGPASSLEDDSSSRASKVARNGPDLGLPIQLSLLRSGDGGLGGSQHMLSFSSPSSQVSFLSSGKDAGGGGGGLKTAQGLPLSYYQHSPAPLYNRNAGYASGSMHASFTGVRGPFTPAQWVELEHQALIYKYFTANVPVPATLLVPIRKALNPSGFSSGSFPSHSYGWGPIHLGYSGSTDPEPGRCRRTDGKKWRCSRDAVPDQKYCERHINRGRHRSRKPVEGQTGQAASGPTNPKVVPTSSSMSSSAKSGGGSSNDLAVAAHQLKNFQASASNLPTDTVVNRFQGSQGLCQMPTSKDLDFAIPKQHAQYEQSPQSEFGFVSSESLVNPWSKTSYINSKNYISFSGFNDQQSQEQQPACHLADRSTIPFPEELKSDWTQLSMAIPKLELSSSSSSNQEKNGISPLRLSRELYGVRDEVNGSSSKRENWVPNSWANPMGGPLGEVLNNAGQGLHLMTQALDGSPQLSSSPTGVLQKGASVSLSNSGSGSSPREEEKKTNQEGACLGDDDLVGSAYAASSSIPAV